MNQLIIKVFVEQPLASPESAKNTAYRGHWLPWPIVIEALMLKETPTKTQNVTKFKNMKCDKIQKLKMWQNSRTQNVTKLNHSKFDKTKELKYNFFLKMWQN